MLTSEIRLVQFINFSSDSGIETIILERSRGNKKVLLLLVIVRITSFTQRVYDRPQHTVLNKKQPTL
jgi:hypothetical protein